MARTPLTNGTAENCTSCFINPSATETLEAREDDGKTYFNYFYVNGTDLLGLP
jgi:hypothetical protein